MQRRTRAAILWTLTIILAACRGGTPTAVVPGGSISSGTTIALPTPAPVATAVTPASVELRGATATRLTPPVASSTAPTARGHALPPGCSREELSRLIERFFAAFNAGDQALLAAFFGRPFQWYSVTEGNEGDTFFRHLSIHDPARLPAYFAPRHAQGERLGLREIWVAPYGPDTVDIIYTLTRVASDLPPSFGGPERLAMGKGAINCREQTIWVWSMAMNERGCVFSSCATPPVGTPRPTAPPTTTTAWPQAMLAQPRERGRLLNALRGAARA